MMSDNNSGRPASATPMPDERARARVKRNTMRDRKGGAYPLNLFDLLVIFVILLAVVLLFFGVTLSDLFASEPEGRSCTIAYEIKLYDVDERFATAIAAGDVLYDAQTGERLGEVAQEVSATPHTVRTVTTILGITRVEMAEVPGRVDLTVRVQSDAARDTEGVGYVIGEQTIRIGGSYALRFPGYTGQGVCTALSETTAE